MQYLTIQNTNLTSSRLIYGCMRIAELGQERGKEAIKAALKAGFTHFDHADIYANGVSESLFGEVLQENPGLREKLILTSKCGIRHEEPDKKLPKRYDFTKAYIKKSVEGSLSRLQTDYLDVLLLHRPDFLMNPEEVAEAFDELHHEGKVKHFGVSNFKPHSLRMLQSFLHMPLIVNQVEINIHNIDCFDDGTLAQCQEMHISPQAWSPLGGGAYPAKDSTFTKEDEKRIREELIYQSKKYQVTDWIIILAWLLKHPSNIFPIIGSTNPERIHQAKEALHLKYERSDWYRLLEARNGYKVP